MDNKSYWIWHWGDYEIYHAMLLNLRRQEFGADYPPFCWGIAAPYVSVEFVREYEGEGGYITAYSTGNGNVTVDGKRYMLNSKIDIPKGKHRIAVAVFKTDGLAAVYVESDICPSDDKWKCSHYSDEEYPVGYSEYFDSYEKNPEIFPFEYEHKCPVSSEIKDDGILYDFGDETFGYLNIENADISDKLGVFYGESREEALDTEHSILLEHISGNTKYRLRQRAFRYIYIKNASKKLDVSMDYEYLPLKQKGNFRCDNELFNRIYDASVRTFHLNSRECFLDGIKRDRWVWSGDAYQSAHINNYLFADADIARRTAIALIGKEPIVKHINSIIDYSFFWIIGLYEHYMTYADLKFLEQMYPMAVKLLEFCENRVDKNGFIIGIKYDWTFIDWSDIDKTGAVCAEQMLFIAAYSAMAKISRALGVEATTFSEKENELTKKVNEFYWNEGLGAFIDSFESGKNNVTRHANIFAIMYDIATDEQIESIIKNVLKNDRIVKITTPYFKGYELDVLGKLGYLEEIEAMLDSYWGGMLRLGATTVWEEFDPNKNGIEHYAMYGNKYAKSLCHAWGAGPIYLFGRYYLGVYPTLPGFETFNVEPQLGGLNEISGTVPVKDGEVRISIDKSRLSVTATKAGGTLIWQNKKYELVPNVEIIIKNL